VDTDELPGEIALQWFVPVADGHHLCECFAVCREECLCGERKPVEPAVLALPGGLIDSNQAVGLRYGPGPQSQRVEHRHEADIHAQTDGEHRHGQQQETAVRGQ
jgi:hypothetical protein